MTLTETETEFGAIRANMETASNCNISNFMGKTKEKLEKHICRVTVRNPTFRNWYTKEWITINRCTYVFHRTKKIEIALFHCQVCAEKKNRCEGKFPLWLPAQDDIEDGIWHLEMTKFLQDGRLDWEAIKNLLRTD